MDLLFFKACTVWVG